MKKKLHSCIREMGLLDRTNVVINLSFTKGIIEYPNKEKLKPLPIDPYNGTKDPINHVQIFQSYMHYVSTLNAIMY